MPAGRLAAIAAASTAAASSSALDSVTRRVREAPGLTDLKYTSCDSALEMDSSKPSAVDSAAASPPAATMPDTTKGRPPSRA